MKVRPGWTEWWPVLSLDEDDDDDWGQLEIPDELVLRFRAALAEFIAAERAVNDYLDSVGQGRRSGAHL